MLASSSPRISCRLRCAIASATFRVVMGGLRLMASCCLAYSLSSFSRSRGIPRRHSRSSESEACWIQSGGSAVITSASGSRLSASGCGVSDSRRGRPRQRVARSARSCDRLLSDELGEGEVFGAADVVAPNRATHDSPVCTYGVIGKAGTLAMFR